MSDLTDRLQAASGLLKEGIVDDTVTLISDIGEICDVVELQSELINQLTDLIIKMENDSDGV